jgi:hypothetical protein
VCWQALNIDESILRLDGAIRLSLRALDINITVHIHARSILLHLLSPSSHILQERLHILLFAQVDWLFVVANLSDLSACCNIREAKIVLVQLLVDRASDLPIQDILTEMELLAHGPCKANSIHGFRSLDHSSNGAQTTGDISLGFLETRHDCLGKLQEECFPLLSALTLVPESELFVCASTQFNEVELALVLQCIAELSAFLRRETPGLKLDAVQLDANHEPS